MSKVNVESLEISVKGLHPDYSRAVIAKTGKRLECLYFKKYRKDEALFKKDFTGEDIMIADIATNRAKGIIKEIQDTLNELDVKIVLTKNT